MLLSQHLEAFQRQQETSGSHLDPLPISKNQNFCEQSELEMVSMCVIHTEGDTAQPASARASWSR